jgi:hypothetical protein
MDCNMYAVACYWSADRKEEERKLTWREWEWHTPMRPLELFYGSTSQSTNQSKETRLKKNRTRNLNCINQVLEICMENSFFRFHYHLHTIVLTLQWLNQFVTMSQLFLDFVSHFWLSIFLYSNSVIFYFCQSFLRFRHRARVTQSFFLYPLIQFFLFHRTFFRFHHAL